MGQRNSKQVGQVDSVNAGSDSSGRTSTGEEGGGKEISKEIGAIEETSGIPIITGTGADTQVIAPLPEEKKRRGRPPGTKNSESHSTPSGTSMLPLISTFTTAIFDMISTKFGNWWKLEEKELNSICIPLTKILERYLPKGTTKYTDVGMLIFALIAVCVPRIMYTRSVIDAGKQAGRNTETKANDAHKQDTDGNGNKDAGISLLKRDVGDAISQTM